MKDLNLVLLWEREKLNACKKYQSYSISPEPTFEFST